MSKIFTVLICDKQIINDCTHKYYIYLKPFLNNSDFVFCEWNTSGKTLDEAVPDLKELIKRKSEWRAIIVNEAENLGFDVVNRKNPFDYISADRITAKDYADIEKIKSRREKDDEQFEKAVNNPLAKLSLWLCGLSGNSSPVVCFGDNDTIEDLDDAGAYYDELNRLGVSAFDYEYDRRKLVRYNLVSSHFESKGELFNPPSSVTLISERAYDMDESNFDVPWINKTEGNYSDFYLDNVYPDKLRYLLFDIPYIRNIRHESSYFNFLSSLLSLCLNEFPSSVLRAYRVYSVKVDIDTLCIQDLCGKYCSKLYETLIKIDDIEKRLAEKERLPLDEESAELLESDVTVPIETKTSDNRDNLMSNYDNIGLSRDCPVDEMSDWNEQYHHIKKAFVRFLREPRRSMKNAAKGPFHEMNTIDDEIAGRLSEYQIEDINYNIEELERSMIHNTVATVFDTEEYNKKFSHADSEIRKEIEKRMTRTKTLIGGAVSAGAFLLGLIPLLFFENNSVSAYPVSLIFVLVALGLFLAVAFGYIISRKLKLVQKFKDFNFAMNGVLHNIESGLSAYAKYLSFAVNIMRNHSILSYKNNTYQKKKSILKFHSTKIQNIISEVKELFSNYIDPDYSDPDCREYPFEYDFTVLKDYEYDMPYIAHNKEIDFFVTGTKAVVPVDYIKSIIITREELYD